MGEKVLVKEGALFANALKVFDAKKMSIGQEASEINQRMYLKKEEARQVYEAKLQAIKAGCKSNLEWNNNKLKIISRMELAYGNGRLQLQWRLKLTEHGLNMLYLVMATDDKADKELAKNVKGLQTGQRCGRCKYVERNNYGDGFGRKTYVHLILYYLTFF